MGDRYTKTERIGINTVESIFLKSFGWIFREQPIVDMGIDAQVEYVNEKRPTGKLIGIQIKTGLSHFYETDEGFTFYLDETHYLYWMNHSLPVLLIGHIPEYEITIWQYVDKNTVEETKKGWKIEIPKSNLLTDLTSKYQIKEIITSKSLDGKITKLFFDKELMKFIKDGGIINIYTEVWHNKTLGRGPFKVILIEGVKEDIVREWKSFYTLTLEELIEKTFPWADFGIDVAYYDENFDESVLAIYPQGWLDTQKIYPYDVLEGEIGLYRINLTLNKIGNGFLDLEEYLDKK